MCGSPGRAARDHALGAARAFVSESPCGQAGLLTETDVRPWRLDHGAARPGSHAVSAGDAQRGVVPTFAMSPTGSRRRTLAPGGGSQLVVLGLASIVHD